MASFVLINNYEIFKTVLENIQVMLAQIIIIFT